MSYADLTIGGSMTDSVILGTYPSPAPFVSLIKGGGTTLVWAKVFNVGVPAAV
jgi:hypothetical protein